MQETLQILSLVQEDPLESSVQSLSHVWLFGTPWTAARQASLSITNSGSLLKLMSIESAMPSNHFILCCPLLRMTEGFRTQRAVIRLMTQSSPWGSRTVMEITLLQVRNIKLYFICWNTLFSFFKMLYFHGNQATQWLGSDLREKSLAYGTVGKKVSLSEALTRARHRQLVPFQVLVVLPGIADLSVFPAQGQTPTMPSL